MVVVLGVLGFVVLVLGVFGFGVVVLGVLGFVVVVLGFVKFFLFLSFPPVCDLSRLTFAKLIKSFIKLASLISALHAIIPRKQLNFLLIPSLEKFPKIKIKNFIISPPHSLNNLIIISKSIYTYTALPPIRVV